MALIENTGQLGWPRLEMPAGGVERLSVLRRLPRDLALGRLGYTIKRPLFALPLYRLMLTGPGPTSLRVTPSDPWPGNAETGTLLVEGIFPLAGRTVQATTRPWSPIGVDHAWLAELHGFEWLRDLRAVGGDTARRQARSLVADWLDHYPGWDPLAWAPAVTGKRLGTWFGQYEFFAASADIAFRHRLLDSMARQARYLYRVLPAGLAGADLITALKGLCLAGVHLPGGDKWLETGLALLHRGLPRQVLSDGGHAARDPMTQLCVLRDLIDVRAALRAGQLEVPPDLQTTIERMASLLRLFRHGDGGLALFNGSNEAEGWQVDLVLQRAGGRSRSLVHAPESGFQRLHAGRSVVLVDAGRQPPPGLDTRAHAGTLSFEMSVGRERLIVNCGAHPARRLWGRAQQASAAHSTLVVKDTNSSSFTADGILTRRPANVTCRREEAEGSAWLDMSHDGYLPVFGLVHHRRLYLGAGGEDLRGEDRLESQVGHDFAIRFHLHPGVRVQLAQDGGSALLRPGRAGGWRFRAKGAALTLEPSVYLGQAGEVRRSQQIVLSGSGEPGETTVKWALQKDA
jgi:uncharacterized heparinase superfamily protein